MSAAAEPLKPVYLIWGEDRGMIDRAVRRLAARVAGDGGMPAERFAAGEHPAEEVVATCQALSFAGVRLVIAEEIGDWRAGDIAAVVAYLEAANLGTCLCLVGGPRPPQGLTHAVERAGTILRYGPDPGAKPADRRRWLAEHFAKEAARLGLEIAPALARQVVERVVVDRPEAHRAGRNALELTREAEKLAAYAAGEPASAEMIRAVVPIHPDARSYQLVDALMAGDAAGAYALLQELATGSDPTPPILIQTALARHFQALAAAGRAGPRPSPAQVTAATGIGGFPAKKLAEQVPRVSSRAVAAAVARVADLELDLRVSSFADLGRGRGDGPRLVLELAARDLLRILSPAAERRGA